MTGGYRIFGKTVQSHTLAIATLVTLAGSATLFSMRSSAKDAKTNPPAISEKNEINGDIDIESLLNEFIKDDDQPNSNN